MKPGLCTVKNFGSFRDLEFEYGNLGLVLLSGDTGTGKSTIADFPCWCLFGETSKGGSADEVISWDAEGPTEVTLEVGTPTGQITVTRVRGTASQNDVYWVEDSAPDTKRRGKNALETQALLSERLGCDIDSYLLSSYFSQWSTSDSFFTSKAKDRRPILERITDVSLPVKLADAASEARKVAKKDLEKLETEKAKLEGRHSAYISQKEQAARSSKTWEKQQALTIAETEAKEASFSTAQSLKYDTLVTALESLDQTIRPAEEFEKQLSQLQTKLTKISKKRSEYEALLPESAKINSELASVQREWQKQERLPDTCPSCNRPGANPHKDEHIAEIKATITALTLENNKFGLKIDKIKDELKGESTLRAEEQAIRREQADNTKRITSFESAKQALEAIENESNIFTDRLKQLRSAKNPHAAGLATADKDIQDTEASLIQKADEIAAKEHRVASLTTTYDLSYVLRGELLHKAVSQLQSETNKHLETYFDGVFMVRFTLDSDKLEVEIKSNDHECSFRSLSGGERRQLTLSFWRALGRLAADTAGIEFPLIIMDEAFNGLSEPLKIKAFRMLEDISKEAESVLVIDHSSGFQSMFDNTFEVTKPDGEHSEIARV